MLHILWVIIKIIGFLLLGMIGLFLGLLLLILFVPIRYRMKLSYYGEVIGSAKITWLLHMISVTISYDQDTSATIRIFGIRLSKRKKKQAEDFLEDVESEIQEGLQTEKETVENQAEEKLNQLEEDIVSSEEEFIADEPPKVKKPSLFEKLTAFFKCLWNKVRNMVIGLYQKFRTFAAAFEAFIQFIQNEANQKTMKLILKNSKLLIRHLLPQKMAGSVTFGFDDPYTTGQALSAASIFYAMCRGSFQFIPVFDEKILEGDIDIKGRIQIGTLTFLLLQVYCNKNFRILLKKWQNR